MIHLIDVFSAITRRKLTLMGLKISEDLQCCLCKLSASNNLFIKRDNSNKTPRLTLSSMGYTSNRSESSASLSKDVRRRFSSTFIANEKSCGEPERLLTHLLLPFNERSVEDTNNSGGYKQAFV